MAEYWKEWLLAFIWFATLGCFGIWGALAFYLLGRHNNNDSNDTE